MNTLKGRTPEEILEIQDAICKAIREGTPLAELEEKYNIEFVKPFDVEKPNEE